MLESVVAFLIVLQMALMDRLGVSVSGPEGFTYHRFQTEAFICISQE